MTVTAKPRSSSPPATWLITRSIPPSSPATTGATSVTASGTVLLGAVAATGERGDQAQRADIEVLQDGDELLGAVARVAAEAGDDHHAVGVAQQRHRVGHVGHRGGVEDHEVVAL